ncbi:MAG: RDD family protein [Epsilonproteobacteria bacterium]|nr:RDD family protein [Campylobacterota bacterium]
MQESSADEYQISTTGKRLSSFFIDDIIVSLFLMAIFYNQLTLLKSAQEFAIFFQENLLAFTVLKVIYHTFFVWQNGMTPGKMIMKIQVIDINTGMIPSFEMALVRAGFRVISDMVFYLGYLLAYFNPLVQTLHDKLAKTIVVDV